MISTADLAETHSRTGYVGTGRLKVYAVGNWVACD
jgi:hypothetical protein